MKSLYLDAFSGISGDMVLGLLVDLGVPVAAIESELRTLPLDGWRLEAGREQRTGIEGCRVKVHCEEQSHHRSWADIDRMLAASALAEKTKALSQRIFRRIGIAEAKVHGVALETVHFHEVGALDSIVDIVGAAAGLVALGVDRVRCAALPLGRGMVETAHGRFPLPAPATLEILRGQPLAADSAAVELVTPTGAAIAAEIAAFGDLPAMTVDRIGYGVGSRELSDRPNLLRGLLGEETSGGRGDIDRVAVLESHLDDANPEWLGALLERLLAAGALDVAYGPLQMKKSRPGVRLTVVAPPEISARLGRLILRESSAIGVRCREEERLKLRREGRTVDTSLGAAQVKLAFDGDEPLRATPEYDSCRQLATASGRPLPEVYRLVERAAERLLRQKRGETNPDQG